MKLTYPITLAQQGRGVGEGASYGREESGASLARSMASDGSFRGKDIEGGKQDSTMDVSIVSSLSNLHCRICYEDFSADEMQSDEVINLGCACARDQAYMHRECALKWFGSKPNTLCEVCGKEAKGLPLELRNKVEAAMQARRKALFNARRQAETMARIYITHALLPAVVLCVVATIVFYNVLGAGMLASMLTATLLSIASLLHWVICPRKHVHVGFVATLGVLFVLLGLGLGASTLETWMKVCCTSLFGYAGALMVVGTWLVCTQWWVSRRQGLG